MLQTDLSTINNQKYDEIVVKTINIGGEWAHSVSSQISGGSGGASSFTNIIKQNNSDDYIDFEKIKKIFEPNSVYSPIKREDYNLYDKFHEITNLLVDKDDNTPYLTVYRHLGLQNPLNVGNYHVELFPSSFTSNPDFVWQGLKHQKSIIKINLKPSDKHLIFTKDEKNQNEVVVTEAFFKVIQFDIINNINYYTCELYPFNFKQMYHSISNIKRKLKMKDLKIDSLDNFFINYFFKNIKNLEEKKEDYLHKSKRIKFQLNSGIDNLITLDLNNYSINEIKLLAKYFQINNYENKNLKILINKISNEIKKMNNL